MTVARTSAQVALDAFHVDGTIPFLNGPETSTELLTQAYGILKVLETSWQDCQRAQDKGLQPELVALKANFIASTFGGISSLIAFAMFHREQNS